MKPPQPNRRLRTARESARLSRNALAEAVSLWLAERDPKGRDVAFDANHLGKIERGIIERPRDLYVAALCAILRMTEAELGFDHQSRATPEDVDRKAFLQAALGAGAGALIARGLPEHDASDLLASIAGPTAHYRRLGDIASTTELAPVVEAHLRLATSVVTNVLPTRDGFAALSEAALMAAWVARERDNAGTARLHYAGAVRFAERAQHPLLTSMMLQGRGTFEIRSGDPRGGVPLLQAARRELDKAGAPAGIYARLAAFEALGHAAMRDRKAALAELRNSESVSDSGRGDLRWPWIFPFDEASAVRYQASTFAALNDLPAARTAFATALPTLTMPRPRAEVQTDHARALARAGHFDEACALAAEALAVGKRYGFERIIREVRALRAELPAGTRVTAALDDALSWNAM
jgi:transcriptional regulator with XRE-family HTH domain